MKKTIGILILILIVFNLNGQRPADDPNYNPLIPKLLSLQHKANSNTIKYRKFSEEMLSLKQLNESINIYVKYEMDLEVAKDPKYKNKPPEKVMNLDLIYSYRYLIPYSSINDLDKLLPEIDLKNGQSILSIDASNYLLKNGKAKKVSVKNKDIKIDTTAQKLTIKFESGAISNNGFLEILIETKTQNFSSLNPTFNINGEFKRLLTISLPDIFKYQLPKDKIKFELQSKEEKKFVFLNIDRSSRDWNNVISEYWTDCLTYAYKVNAETILLTNISFKLEKLELPSNIDIGIPPVDLF
jgi:hypothetical protein